MTGSTTFHTTLATPLGPMRAAFDGPALVELAFVDTRATAPAAVPAQFPTQVPTRVASHLAALQRRARRLFLRARRAVRRAARARGHAVPA